MTEFFKIIPKMEFPDIVELNVGGRHVSTFLSTLTKYPDSMLAAMLSGRHPVARDKDGRFFIDADGDIFTHLLNFLRFETLPPSDEAIQVSQHAEYFGIDELKLRSKGVVLPTQDELFEVWASNIPGYSEGLSSVKEQLMTCKILDGLMFIWFKQKEICEEQEHPWFEDWEAPSADSLHSTGSENQPQHFYLDCDSDIGAHT